MGLDESWLVQYDEAVMKATSEKKKILVLSMRSEGGEEERRLVADVFSQKEFQDYAREHLVLLYVEDWRFQGLPLSQRRHNFEVWSELAFGWDFPSVKVISAEGKALLAMSRSANLETFMSFLKTDPLTPGEYSPYSEYRQGDFKVELTALGVEPDKLQPWKEGMSFTLIPGEKIYFRFQYDIPEGQSATIWGRPAEEGDWQFGKSRLFKGKGEWVNHFTAKTAGKCSRIVFNVMANQPTRESRINWKTGGYEVKLTWEDKVEEPVGGASVDMTGWVPGPNGQWLIRYEEALARAQAEGKCILVLSTGSDWCPPCKKLKAEVLGKKAFLDYAKENLVLLYLDMPRKIKLADGQKAYNARIRKQLQIDGGVPTTVIVGPDGTVAGRQKGYGGADKYMAFIGDALKKTRGNGR